MDTSPHPLKVRLRIKWQTAVDKFGLSWSWSQVWGREMTARSKVVLTLQKFSPSLLPSSFTSSISCFSDLAPPAVDNLSFSDLGITRTTSLNLTALQIINRISDHHFPLTFTAKYESLACCLIETLADKWSHYWWSFFPSRTSIQDDILTIPCFSLLEVLKISSGLNCTASFL